MYTRKVGTHLTLLNFGQNDEDYLKLFNEKVTRHEIVALILTKFSLKPTTTF